MGKRKRQWIEPADQWQQLHVLTASAKQYRDELIRPIALFGHSPAERAFSSTGLPRLLHRQSDPSPANRVAAP